MKKPDAVRITVRYLGVVRLMSGRRSDVLEFDHPPSVTELLNGLQEVLSSDIFKEVLRQTLVLSRHQDLPGTVLVMPKDKDTLIKDGYCLTVVTPVTGG